MKKPVNHACVIVMGDLGRSPRMLNHALCIADTLENPHVDLIGFAGMSHDIVIITIK